MKVVIVGAGNMGSIFAAQLARAGHEVTLVARNRRLRELEAHGLRVRSRLGGEVETHRLHVLPELRLQREADVILVMTQRPHLEALLPALIAHPCPRVCFMFNCSAIEPSWQAALGKRLVWGFPAALGGTHAGIVEYILLPAALAFLQITTVGVVEGGDAEVARELVALLRSASIPAVFHGDMRSWLLSHSALMLPPMAMYANKLRASTPTSLSWAEARTTAAGHAEAFAVVRRAGARVTPANMWLLSQVPRSLVAVGLWCLSRAPAYRRGLADHVPNARAELQAMYAGLAEQAKKSGTATPNLSSLAQPLAQDSSPAELSAPKLRLMN